MCGLIRFFTYFRALLLFFALFIIFMLSQSNLGMNPGRSQYVLSYLAHSLHIKEVNRATKNINYVSDKLKNAGR